MHSDENINAKVCSWNAVIIFARRNENRSIRIRNWLKPCRTAVIVKKMTTQTERIF